MTRHWNNPDGSCKAPAAEATAAALRAVAGDTRVACRDQARSGARFRVVSYREDFPYLWGVGTHQSAGFGEAGRDADGSLVLIWDGLPAAARVGSIDIGRYLTPLDWVVGLALAINAGTPVGRPLPGLRVLILDVASRQWPAADSVRFFDQFPLRDVPALPWVHFYPLAGARGERWRFGSLLVSAAQADGEAMPTLREAAEKQGDLDTLRRVWAASLTNPAEPGEHHAIANLVGPLLLLGDSSGDLQVEALGKLLRRLSLLPPQPAGAASLDSSAPWIDWDEDAWAEKARRVRAVEDKPLNVVVVDDCVFRHRWGEVVCRALGATPAGTPGAPQPALLGRVRRPNCEIDVYGTESAEGWLDSVGLTPPLRDRRYRLDFRPGGVGAAEVPLDMLFLDLRLFQGQSFEAEARFFARLLELAESLPPEAELPWPAIPAGEVARLRAWLGRVAGGQPGTEGEPPPRREDPEYILALTLLPRLLSLADPSLPIILFSSTGRRDILAPLRQHGTILTDWEKPRLLAVGGEALVQESAVKFRRALTGALDLVVARRLCARLPAAPPRPRAVPPPSAAPSDAPWTIELTLDETGEVETRLEVGGLLVVFPPGVSPEDLDSHLTGLHPWVRLPDGKRELQRQREIVAQTLLSWCATTGAFAAVVSLRGRRNDAVYSSLECSDDLHDERVADNLYRELFRCVVELAVYHFARHRIPGRARFNVRAAARHVPLPPGQQGVALRQALRERWGLTAEYVGPEEILWNSWRELRGVLGHAAAPGSHRAAVLDAAQVFSTLLVQAETAGEMPRPELSIRYFRWDSPRPLVEEVMREYRGSAFEPVAGLVRAFSLNCHGRPGATAVPVLHFFADAVLGSAPAGPALQQLRSQGLQGNYGSTLAVLLRAHRLALQGFPAEAIAWGGREVFAAGVDPVVDSLLHDLHLEARVLAGQDFLTLARRVREPPPPAGNVNDLEGTVVRLSPAFVIVHDAYGNAYRATQQFCPQFARLARGMAVRFRGLRGPILGQFLARDVRPLPGPGTGI